MQATSPAETNAPQNDAGTLAVILGVDKTERRNYDSAIANARTAVRILNEVLGPAWLDERAPALNRELATEVAAVVHRSSESQFRNPLHGAGLAPTYVALTLAPVPGAGAGWQTFWALILAGCVLRQANEDAVAKSNLDSLAQFLTSTYSMQGGTARKERTSFLAKGTPALNLGLLSRMPNKQGTLPAAMVGAVRLVSQAILYSKPRLRKPVATRPPATEAPVMAQPSIPEDDGTFAAEVVASPNTPLSDAVRNEAAQAAESAAEQTATSIAETGDTSPDVSFHERLAHARRAFMDVRQGLWARDQWDALNRLEMLRSVRTWLDRAQTAGNTGDLLTAEAALLTLLMGCTGWTDDRLWTVPFVNTEQAVPPEHHRWVRWDSGELVFPIPESDTRYKPHVHGHSALVLPVAQIVRLKLPFSIAGLIRNLATLRGSPEVFWFGHRLADLVGQIRHINRVGKQDEARDSPARIRKAHLLELLNASQDIAISQIICGDLIGAADVSLTYVACAQSKVQDLYAKVVLAHGYGECPDNPDSGLVGGSLLQIETSRARQFSGALRRGLGQPNGHAGDDLADGLRTHDRFVASLAWLICATTGLRPQNNIGELTIRSFSLSGRCAVFGEKALDEGHLGRLVPLCEVLIESLVAYGRHLHAFAGLARLPDSHRAAARAALAGTGPLLFVSTKGKLANLTVADMARSTPREWILPSNTFRHRIASQLRERGCPAVYVEALLGHMELGVQPFGLESFMDPVPYLTTTARHLQALAIDDGWRPLYGLPSPIEQPWDARPVGRWALALEPSHNNSIEELRARNRCEMDAAQQTLAEEISGRVKAAVEMTSPGFFSNRDGRLSEDEVRGLRRSLTDVCASHAETEVTVNTLRRFIIDARVERGWKIARTPYFFRGNVEPAPFSREYPAAYESFLAVRGFFVDALNGRAAAARPLAARARLVLALITWHGVATWMRLESILRNIHRATLIDGLPDAIAVPYEVGHLTTYETAELLRSRTALAAHNFSSRDIVIKASKRELGDELGRSLPGWLTTLTGEELIDSLLAAARIAHNFEHAPPLRIAWTNALPSIGISIQRMQRLFGEQEIRLFDCEDVSSNEELGDDAAVAVKAVDAKADQLRSLYRKLRAILRAYRERITAAARARGSTPRPALSRPEMIAEIERLNRSMGEAGAAPRLLTEYALKLLNDLSGKKPRLELQTIYNYVVGAGGTLMRVQPRAELIGRESEDLLVLYRDVVDAAPSGYRPFLAKYLSYFHAFLHANYGAPPVDLRGFGGSIVGLPDVGLVAPREFQAAQRILNASSAPSQFGSLLISRQAAHAATLGYASGIRTSEATNRQLKDIVIEGGSGALLIRRNQLGTVKTRRATRCINLDGWISNSNIERMYAESMSVIGAEQSVRPLFPDADQPESVVSSDVFASFIGRALRAATGEARARNYWLRHTSASMEMLYLFSEDFLLRRIACDAHPQIPFPLNDSSSEFAVRLAGNDALSQIHAAAFRSRRGHASMTTSITTYIHTISLIEPHGSRLSVDALTSHGVGALLDRSPESIRQALCRGEQPRTGASRGREALALMGAAVRNVASALSQAHSDPAAMITTIKLGSVARCVRRYFRTGDMDSSLELLGATPAALQLARESILSLPFVPANKTRCEEDVHASGISVFAVAARNDKAELHLGPKSVDSSLARILLNRVRRESATQAKSQRNFWRLVLCSADTRDRTVRCKSAAELQCLVIGAQWYLKDSEKDFRPALVISERLENAAASTELNNHGTFAGLPTCRIQFSDRDPKLLPIAFTLLTRGSQRRISSLLFVAAAREVWNTLALDTSLDAG